MTSSFNNSDNQIELKPVRIDFGKRLSALIIDVTCCYLVGIFVSFIPFVNNFLPLSTVMVLAFLCRDYLFEGRGVGKNLMGLQVVRLHGKEPISLMQSIKRNIVLVAPCVVLTVFALILRFVPIAIVNTIVIGIINAVGMIYCAIVIPMEGYRVYSRADGMRLGDQFADTALIESSMDFSKILPRQ